MWSKKTRSLARLSGLFYTIIFDLSGLIKVIILKLRVKFEIFWPVFSNNIYYMRVPPNFSQTTNIIWEFLSRSQA